MRSWKLYKSGGNATSYYYWYKKLRCNRSGLVPASFQYLQLKSVFNKPVVKFLDIFKICLTFLSNNVNLGEPLKNLGLKKNYAIIFCFFFQLF